MAARPCFVINGVDYIGLIRESGIKWECNDLDSEDSGRTLDGVMHRSRVAQKRKITVSLIPLTTDDFAALSAELAEQYVDVKILDPKIGAQTTFTFYGSSINATTMHYNGTDCYWSDGEFSLIER